MSQTLTDIAQQLKDANKKVQLIYAFNGTGKTRLSRAFKELIAPKVEGEEAQSSDLAGKKVLYYSAFTEDLFYWKNDLERDAEPKLVIQPNAFTRWVLEEQGQDQSITATFQRYTSDKLRGCARFCVNGQLSRGLSPIVCPNNEHQETRSPRRAVVWPAGQLQEA